MNKETIYIETNDDITSILSKIQSSEKKIIALVPPKRPSVLLSSINIKLIARSAKKNNKVIVLVTTDDSLTKLAMSAKLPVAPSLKSRPVLPGAEESSTPDSSVSSVKTSDPEEFLAEPEASKLVSGASEEAEEEFPEEDDGEEEGDSSREDSDEGEEDDEDVSEDDSENAEDAVDSVIAENSQSSAEKSSKSSKKSEKKSKKSSKSPEKEENWLKAHKKWIIFGSVTVVVLAVVLVWAFVFAPEVKLGVKVRTTSGNFAENITVSKDITKEDLEKATFYAHEETVDDEKAIKFTATGQKDVGESATGTLVLYFQSPSTFTFNVGSGSTFSYNGLDFTSVSTANIYWDGKKTNVCDNKDDYEADTGCLMSASITVKASAPGEKYNVSGRQNGWSSREYPSLSVYNSSDMSGGTSKIVTTVQQSDVDMALDKLKSETQGDGKNALMRKLSETVLPIDASFKVTTTDPVASPAVGEEVPEGTTPSVSTKTTYTILTVDRAKIEEFIKSKANLEEGRKLYSYGEPFVEYFSETDENTYSAKLKTTYKFGPEISETEVLNKVQGKKIGRVEPDLKTDFPGIASVSIEKSHFWVSSVPKNPNKVKIELEVEE